jgi:hypothetical protein
MRFDVTFGGSHRITGVRNFRQALASPYPVPSFPIRCGLPNLQFTIGNQELGSPMSVTKLSRGVLVLGLAGLASACALSLRQVSVVDLNRHPGRYQDRTVSISGTVTSSWGLPLVPFRFYKVDDGTGELTVLSENSRMPARGERVRVRGRVSDVAVLGGRPLGLHLREESLYVKR